jgi:hypothetical protein
MVFQLVPLSESFSFFALLLCCKTWPCAALGGRVPLALLPPAVLYSQHLLPDPLHVRLLPGSEPAAADTGDRRDGDLLRDDVAMERHHRDAEHLRRLARGVGLHLGL